MLLGDSGATNSRPSSLVRATLPHAAAPDDGESGEADDGRRQPMAQEPRDAQATGEGTPLVETRLDGTEVLVGVFAEREAVERAVNMLQAGGFDPATISIVAKDRATS